MGDWDEGMHYYLFNIGDYQSHTGHLEPLEDIAYRRMLDWCYLHEKPLPLDVNDIGRLIRMREHLATIRDVLNEFFEKSDAGWWHSRIEAEIGHYRSKVEQASKAGKASAERRANARSNGRSTDIATDVQPTKNQEPITKNQIEEANASLSGTPFPPCPQQEILNLYRKHLEHLPQPRVWEGTRAAHLRARWVQAAKPSSYSPNGYKTRAAGLEWWDGFFAYVANETKLAQGFESNGRVWRPDLEWIVNPANFAKIIDGKYQK
jgi:uncharacterized protein YdaU (DUF1376 family)